MASKTLVALLLVLLLIGAYFMLKDPILNTAKSILNIGQQGTCGIGESDCTSQYIPKGEKLEYSSKIETPLKSISASSGSSIDVIQAPSGVPYSSRGGVDINMIVLHHTGGDTAQGAINWWKTSKQSSAHYVIDKDGTIYQTVDEKNKAWHAGCCPTKTPKCSTCIKPETAAYNARSIGIEIANTGCQEYTDEQYASLSALIKDILARHPAILLDNSHIIGHFEITSDKWDVSDVFAWSNIGLPNHMISEDTKCNV